MEALDELFTKLGFDRRTLTRITLIFWILFVGSCVLAVYLSAWDMKKGIVGMLYVYMTLVALPLVFSPVLWIVGGGILSLAGQFGGEKGPSFKDAVVALKEYGAPALDKSAYAILFAIPVWHIAMLIFDTKGIEWVFLTALPVLPTLIYLCIRRWKTGEAFEAIARNTVLGLVILGALWGVWNAIDRAVSDPVVLKAREVLEERAEKGQTAELKLFEAIKEAVEHNEEDKKIGGKNQWPVEKTYLDWYNERLRLGGETAVTRAGKFISSAASAAITDDEGSKSATTSTSASWLGKHWPVLVATTLVILIVAKLIARWTKPVTATVTVAASPAARRRSLWDGIGNIVLIITLAWGSWALGPWGKTLTVDRQFGHRQAGSIKIDFPPGTKVRWDIIASGGRVNTNVVHPGRHLEPINLAEQITLGGAWVGECFIQPKKGKDIPINFLSGGGYELPLSPEVSAKLWFGVCHPKGSLWDWLGKNVPGI